MPGPYPKIKLRQPENEKFWTFQAFFPVNEQDEKDFEQWCLDRGDIKLSAYYLDELKPEDYVMFFGRIDSDESVLHFKLRWQ